MIDTNGEIEYKGKKYSLVFDLNVMQEIQEEYGTLEKWFELTDKEGEEPNIKAIIFGFTKMINEGIEIDDEDLSINEKRKPFTLKQMGRVLDEVGLNKAIDELNNTVIESTKSTQKNV